MLFHPTTRMNILRGTTTDTLGDETDGGHLIAEGVPAALSERTKLVTTPGSDVARVIRIYSARMSGTVNLQVGDRVEDTQTGIPYVVDSTTRGAATFGAGDLRIDLRRVT